RPEARAPRAGTERVLGTEHYGVGKELPASLKPLGKRLRSFLGVEHVLFFDRHPGKRASLPNDLLVSLCLLGLQPGQLVAGCLPFLAGSDLMVGHLISSGRTRRTRIVDPPSV